MAPSWILHHLGRDVLRNPLPPTALVAAFFALASVAGVGTLAFRAAPRLEEAVAQNVHVIAYLREDVEVTDVDQLVAGIRRMPGVAGVRNVSPEEALLRLRSNAAWFGSAGSSLAHLEAGFLPRSLEVTLAPGPNIGARTAELGRRLKAAAGVGEVDAMTAGLARIESWRAAANFSWRVAIALAVLLGAAAVLLGFRGGIARRRQRAEALWQLGASPLFIRLPGALAGTLSAAAGTLLAVVLLRVGTPVVWAALAPTAGVAGPPPEIFGYELVLGVAVALAVGIVVGTLATPVPKEQNG